MKEGDKNENKHKKQNNVQKKSKDNFTKCQTRSWNHDIFTLVPTKEQVGIYGCSCILSLKILVKERSKPCNNRREAALGQDKDQEKRAQQEVDKLFGKT